MVTSSHPGADISLNGVATGMATNTTVPDLVEGEYTVTVTRAGYVVTPENGVRHPDRRWSGGGLV